MIFRRIAEAIRRQDLTTITIELAVLVVGIALGLQVDQWNSDRQQRKLEQSLIERLEIDFDRIDARLTSSLSDYEGYLATIARVRDRVQAGQPPESPDDRERFLDDLGNMLGSRIPAGPSPTYVEMLSSGVFDVLQSDELRRSLVAYDQSQVIAAMGWQTLRDQSLLFSEPLMYAMTLGLPPDEGNNIFPVAFDFEKMQRDPAFDGALGVQISVQANNRDLQQSQLEAARAVLDLLDAQKAPE